MNLILFVSLIFSVPHDSLYWVDSVFVIYQKDTPYAGPSNIEEIEIADFRTGLIGVSSVLLRDLGGRISPSVRGLDDKETQIYLGDVTVNSPVFGYTPLNVFPADFLDHVAVIKEGVIDGGEFPLVGCLSLNLKKDGKLFKTEMGSFGKKGASLVLGDGFLSGGIHISSAINDFLYRDRFGRTYKREDNDESLLSVYFLKEGETRVLSFFSSYEAGLPRRGYGQEGDDRERYHDFVLSVGKGPFSFSSYTEDYTFFPSNSEGDRYLSGRVTLEMRKETFGLGTRLLWMHNCDMGKKYNFIFFPSVRFLKHGEKFGYELISRLEVAFSENKKYFLPHIFWGFLYELSPDISTYASFKVSGRTPYFSELYWKNTGWAVGNPDLKGEKSLGGDLGVRARKFGSFELVLFVHSIKDAIFWKPSGNLWEPQNVNKLRIYGLEARHKSRVRTLDLSFSVTYMLNSTDKGGVLPYRPKIWGRTEIAWKGISLVLSGMGRRPTYFSEESAPLPAFYLVDIYLQKNIFFWGSFLITVDFALNNVFDTDYEVISGYPMPGRNFSLSFSVRL